MMTMNRVRPFVYAALGGIDGATSMTSPETDNDFPNSVWVHLAVSSISAAVSMLTLPLLRAGLQLIYDGRIVQLYRNGITIASKPFLTGFSTHNVGDLTVGSGGNSL